MNYKRPDIIYKTRVPWKRMREEGVSNFLLFQTNLPVLIQDVELDHCWEETLFTYKIVPAEGQDDR